MTVTTVAPASLRSPKTGCTEGVRHEARTKSTTSSTWQVCEIGKGELMQGVCAPRA